MCVVSAILDYGRGVDPNHWTPPVWYQYVDTVQQAKRFDEAAGEPHCEDPLKEEWYDAMEALIERKIRAEHELEEVNEAIKELKEKYA